MLHTLKKIKEKNKEHPATLVVVIICHSNKEYTVTRESAVCSRVCYVCARMFRECVSGMCLLVCSTREYTNFAAVYRNMRFRLSIGRR